MATHLHFRACRRSGTNYLQRLVQQNWDVDITVGEWKHGLPPNETPFLTIIRDPYAYLRSTLDYYDWTDLKKQTLRYLAETWTTKNQLYTEHAIKHAYSCQVRYEDLLNKEKWPETMQHIEDTLDLPPKNGPKYGDTTDKVDPVKGDFDPEKASKRNHVDELGNYNARNFKRGLRDCGAKSLTEYHDYELERC